MFNDFDDETLAQMALCIQYVMRRLDAFPAEERAVILESARAFLDRYGELDQLEVRVA